MTTPLVGKWISDVLLKVFQWWLTPSASPSVFLKWPSILFLDNLVKEDSRFLSEIINHSKSQLDQTFTQNRQWLKTWCHENIQMCGFHDKKFHMENFLDRHPILQMDVSGYKMDICGCRGKMTTLPNGLHWSHCLESLFTCWTFPGSGLDGGTYYYARLTMKEARLAKWDVSLLF